MVAKTLNQVSTMPQMGRSFSGWMMPLTLHRITQVVIDGLAQDLADVISFIGVFQPFGPNQLKLKPEGQRSWQWVQIHAVAGTLNLDNGDKILFNGTKYKIMAQNDYSLNGYIEYHAVQDFDDQTGEYQSEFVVDNNLIVTDG